MTNWTQIITERHSLVHIQPGDKLHIESGASISAIHEQEQSLGITFPDEFHDLYQQCNGFGLTGGHESAELWWFCRPLSEIEKFTDDVRNWFIETHPKLACRFFPFVDWGNGDAMGYLVDEIGLVLPGLYCFEHENFGFDEDDEPEEFLVKWNDSIKELLIDGAGLQ